MDPISWSTWVPRPGSPMTEGAFDERGVGEGLTLVGALVFVQEALPGGEVGDAGHDGRQGEGADGEGERDSGP